MKGIESSESAVADTAVRDSNVSSASSQERWKKALIKKNKGFLAQPINQVAFQMSNINQMFPPRPNPPQVVKTLFPRSVVYEIPYKKKQAEIKIQEALRREREALAEKVKMKMAADLESNRQQLPAQQGERNEELEKMKEEMKPFWYEEGKETGLPPRKLGEYDVNTGMRVERPDEDNTKERMGLADSRNYIPGQVSGKLPPHLPPQRKKVDKIGDNVQMSAHPALPYRTMDKRESEDITETERNIRKLEGECHPKRPEPPGGLVDHYPIDYMLMKKKPLERPKVAPTYEFGRTDVKGKLCRDFPGTKARLTTPWGDLRSEEFMKVGKPFKNEAARWCECTMPPFKPQEEIKAIRQRLMTKYQLNIQ